MSDTATTTTDPLTAAKQVFWAQDAILTVALDCSRAAAAAVICAALATVPRVIGGVFRINEDGLLVLDHLEDIDGETVTFWEFPNLDDVRGAFGSRQVALTYGDNMEKGDGIWFSASNTGLDGLADHLAELTAKAARAHNNLPSTN